MNFYNHSRSLRPVNFMQRTTSTFHCTRNSGMGSVFELRCEVQQYAWGRLGMNSEVARLSKLANPDFDAVADQPYAELWMGAHTKAPSQILRSTESSLSLREYINANPTVLGSEVMKLFNNELPFLFKVLSVNKSLSIQAHPNKSHAEKLHAESPEIYKDSNHKPEMAIALTPFECLCGFRPLCEIQNFLIEVPEFHAVVGKDAAEDLLKCGNNDKNVSTCLKACFSNVMKCDPKVREENLSKLVNRLSKMKTSSQTFIESLGELLLRLNDQFPGDVGCFVIYFLNHIELMPSEAMYLGANVPHAYLNGNCIECMACSDNVVRAGLTPKLIDVPTLCEMLEYQPSTVDSRKFPSCQIDGDPYVTSYKPPIDDFAVQKISVPENVPKYTISAVDSASILLVLEGNGTSCDVKPKEISVRPGAVLFISANTSINISLKGGKFVGFRALCML